VTVQARRRDRSLGLSATRVFDRHRVFARYGNYLAEVPDSATSSDDYESGGLRGDPPPHQVNRYAGAPGWTCDQGCSTGWTSRHMRRQRTELQQNIFVPLNSGPFLPATT
jgi:hypothetical protein